MFSTPQKTVRPPNGDDLRRAHFEPYKKMFEIGVENGIILDCKSGDLNNPGHWAWPLDENLEPYHPTMLNEAFKLYDIPMPYCGCATLNKNDKEKHKLRFWVVGTLGSKYRGDILVACSTQHNGCTAWARLNNIHQVTGLFKQLYPLRKEPGEGILGFDRYDLLQNLSAEDSQTSASVSPFISPPARRTGFSLSPRGVKRALPTTPTPRRQKEKMKVPDDADIIEISSSDEVFPPSNQQASQKKPIEKTTSHHRQERYNTSEMNTSIKPLSTVEFANAVQSMKTSLGLSATEFQRAFGCCDCGRWYMLAYMKKVHQNECPYRPGRLQTLARHTPGSLTQSSSRNSNAMSGPSGFHNNKVFDDDDEVNVDQELAAL